MTSRRFAALGLLATACSTTTVATSADPRAHAWLAEHAGSEMQIETTDRGPDQRGVVLEAASPTQITFRTRADTVVPIDRAMPPPSTRTVRGPAGSPWSGTDAARWTAR